MIYTWIINVASVCWVVIPGYLCQTFPEECVYAQNGDRGKMNNFSSGDVVAQVVKLHYYRSGGALMPLVLVHGITDDGLCWTPVAEVLSKNFDVIMVDMRGHGKSEAPEAGYTLGNLAGELADLIRVLGLEKPILLGHSMGAIASMLLAGLFPDVPRAILLEDPPPFWCPVPQVVQDNDIRNGLEGWIDGNKRKTSTDLYAEGRTNAAWSEAELEPWVNSKHRYSPKIVELVHPKDMTSIDFPNCMQHITSPVLLLSSDKQMGAASSPEEIEKLKPWIPQLQLAHVTGAGHNIRRDQFERYMQIVNRFLAEFQA